jgi:hypothetical protein
VVSIRYLGKRIRKEIEYFKTIFSNNYNVTAEDDRYLMTRKRQNIKINRSSEAGFLGGHALAEDRIEG